MTELIFGDKNYPTYAIGADVLQHKDTGKHAVGLQVYELEDGRGKKVGDPVKDDEHKDDLVLQIVFCKRESLQAWKRIIDGAITSFDELESLVKEETA